ncbi:MAG: hypothetical protein QNJ42_23665 [Crocosphaera sp.]|nr:hypothetical protein [Crocosphaera sp.]
MAYDIWLSLKTRELLEKLKRNEPETYQKIREELEKLSIDKDNFKTGVPERIEVFVANNLKIYYRILHRLKSIDVIDIRELL